MKSNTTAWHQAFRTAGTVALLLATGLADSQQATPGTKSPASIAMSASQAQANAISMRADNRRLSGIQDDAGNSENS